MKDREGRGFMKPKIGIVSYDARALPSNYKLDDKLVKDALCAKDAEALIVSWRNTNIDWASFDKLVLRSCWDSHYHIDMYKTWLNKIKSRNVRLVNDIDVIQWNFDKEIYLDDLYQNLPISSSVKGIIIPSVFYTINPAFIEHVPFQSAAVMTLKDILNTLERSENGHIWRGKDIVLKPTISGDGYRTFLINRSGTHHPVSDIIALPHAEESFSEMLGMKDLPGVMIQPLVEGIQDGEYSLIYIVGEFSHAVNKLTDTDDFKNRREMDRVGINIHDLPDGMLDFSDEIWRFVETKFGPDKVIYARIDLIKDHNDCFTLLELELVDPNLQFVRIPELYYSDKMHPTESEG